MEAGNPLPMEEVWFGKEKLFLDMVLLLDFLAKDREKAAGTQVRLRGGLSVGKIVSHLCKAQSSLPQHQNQGLVPLLYLYLTRVI